MLLLFTLFLNSFLRLIKLNPTEWFSSLNSCIQAWLDFENSVFYFPWKLIRNVLEVIVCCRKKSLRSYLHPFLFQESLQGALSLTNISWAFWGWGWGCLWSRIEWWALGSYQLRIFLHLLLTTHPRGCFIHHSVARKAVLLKSLCFLYQTRAVGRGCLSQQRWSENSSMAII